jgi:transcriptional regulator with XRE-family HTH domain
MRVETERLDIKLTNAELFAQIMKANGYSIRTLTEAVKFILIRNKSKAKISKSTIGYLRSGGRNTVTHDVALAIAEAFKLPPSALFTPKIVPVVRDIPPTRSKK